MRVLKRLLASLVRFAPAAGLSSALPAGIPNPGLCIIDGKIVPHYACQTDIVDHCNLACRDCDHVSPIAPKRCADPDSLYRDFSLLAKVYTPRLVQLLGGEPLLHPNLLDVIAALRASGISERVMLYTNGQLLERMPDVLWESLDDLEISVYPGFGPDSKRIAAFKAKAKEFNVRLEVYYYKEFRRSFSVAGGHDRALIERLYRNCKKVHVWGCHSIYDGHIYRCPQSIFVPRMLGLPPHARARDGLRLRDAPDFRDQLYHFLVSPEPLQACLNCLGTAGILRPHRQSSRQQWLADQDGTFDDLVDELELRRIEAEIHIQKPDHIKALIESSDT